MAHFNNKKFFARETHSHLFSSGSNIQRELLYFMESQQLPPAAAAPYDRLANADFEDDPPLAANDYAVLENDAFGPAGAKDYDRLQNDAFGSAVEKEDKRSAIIALNSNGLLNKKFDKEAPEVKKEEKQEEDLSPKYSKPSGP